MPSMSRNASRGGRKDHHHHHHDGQTSHGMGRVRSHRSVVSADGEERMERMGSKKSQWKPAPLLPKLQGKKGDHSWSLGAPKLGTLEFDKLENKAKLSHPIVQRAIEQMAFEIAEKNLTPKQLFRMIDVDGSGVLDRSEMQGGLRAIGVSIKPTELDAIMRTFDSEHHGSIDYWEFHDLINPYIEQAKEVIKGQEEALAAAVEPPVTGEDSGARVQVLIELPKKDPPLFDPRPFKSLNERGTVIGHGKSRGTVLVKFDSSHMAYTLRPNQLKRIGWRKEAKKEIMGEERADRHTSRMSSKASSGTHSERVGADHRFNRTF
mmetsp:Transcript_68973/g.165525  ORF Transcript_68973/g.165525 Transcript_68973/m.165525 type:complete len:320 (+) Transcript_68973:157-1116(+)